MQSTVRIDGYNGDEIITSTKCTPLIGHLPFADHSFKAIQTMEKERFNGAGLYAVLLDGYLIYIGKYLGKKQNWNSGNIIATRWVKHIGTFSMLERTLSFSNKALGLIQEKALNDRSANQYVADLYQHIGQANYYIMTKETGCRSTFERFCIAEKLWQDNFKEKLWMSRFTFLYCQIQGDFSTVNVRKLVSQAEDAAIDIMQPKANFISRRKSKGEFEEQEVRQNLENILLEAFDEDSTKKNCFIEKKQAESPDIYELSLEESFFEMLGDETDTAYSFIIKLQECIESRKLGDASVWYIKPNKKTPQHIQLRIRKHNDSKKGFINAITLDWRSKKKVFSMQSIIPQSDLEKVGLKIDSVRHDPLKNRTIITPAQLKESMSSIIDVICSGIDLR